MQRRKTKEFHTILKYQGHGKTSSGSKPPTPHFPTFPSSRRGDPHTQMSVMISIGSNSVLGWLQIGQSWRTYGTKYSMQSQVFFLFCPTTVSMLCTICVYTHICLTVYRLYMNYRCYQIILQWNIFTQIWAVRSVDWIFMVGATAWR